MESKIMNVRSIIYIVFILFISGCASFTPQSVIDGHKAKQVIILDGSVEKNFQVAMELLPVCYEGLNHEVNKIVGPHLAAEVYSSGKRA